MHDRLIQIVALIVLAGGILGAFMLTPQINHQRVERGLTYDVEVGDDANAAYTLAASLGSFRGVAVNFMWQRAERLKQEGKYFEANNLAEMITTLQPRYPEAWNFHGWNMAYNISVKCKTAEERWDWVQKGMNLIRDRGIPNNPNAVVLYRSLGWILGHKMAGQTDDMQWYYKERWVDIWQTLLGIPDPRWRLNPEFSGEKQPSEEELDPLKHGLWVATDQMRAISLAANTYLRRPDRPADDYNASNYFQTLSPDAIARFKQDNIDLGNAGLLDIIQELETLKGPEGQELGLGLNVKTLKALGRVMLFRDAGYTIDNPAVISNETVGVEGVAIKAWMDSIAPRTILIMQPFVKVAGIREQVKAQYPDRQVVDLMPMLDLLRALALIDDYHMDPAYMVKCMERFGPLDWRHPSAHAVYWTALGTLRAEQWSKDKDRIDFVNANRATIHALQNLAHQGTISYRPRVEALGTFGQSRIHNAADTRMIPAYERAVLETKELIEQGVFGDRQKNVDTYDRGYENFLQSAVVLYYLDSNEEYARRYYQRVQDQFANDPDSVNATDGDYNLQVADFVRVRMQDELGFQTIQMIEFWIRQAWRQGVTTRDPAVMQRYLAQGKATYDQFLAERQTSVKNDADVQARQDLAPFGELVLVYFLEVMNDPSYTLPQKAAVWRQGAVMLANIEAPQPLAFVGFMEMYPLLNQQAQAEGWGEGWQSQFLEPRGFREWYQQMQQQQPAQTGPVRP